LLGLGGWLVIQGQLSLGQLVAAELVLSVAFFGVSQLGTYLAYFYELCASIEELSLFDKIEQEKETGEVVTLESSSLKVSGAATRALQSTDIDFELPAGMRVMGIAESHAVQRSLMDLLRRYERPARGFVTVGGIDIMSILPHTLRQHVIYLARPTLVEMTMREYLDLSGSKDNLKRDLEVLEAVGLSDAIARLPDGLDTHLSVSGWPLSINETMQLRLAAAIIAEPRVLVLNQLFDVMPEDVLKRALDLLQSSCDTLVIYFTGKARDVGFNRYLHLGHNEQIVYDSLDTLIRDRADDELRASISIPGAMNPAPAQS
jgi:ABC-type bacteriocin/lantibiotic exporter with double-glycine peptidase domain